MLLRIVELSNVIASADENVLRNNNQVVNTASHLKHEKQKAIDAFRIWGANAKIDYLEREFLD